MDKKRKKSLEFHIQEKDYFSTLATVLNSIREDIDKVLRSRNTLNRLKNDLMYIEDNYEINGKGEKS